MTSNSEFALMRFRIFREGLLRALESRAHTPRMPSGGLRCSAVLPSSETWLLRSLAGLALDWRRPWMMRLPEALLRDGLRDPAVDVLSADDCALPVLGAATLCDCTAPGPVL